MSSQPRRPPNPCLAGGDGGDSEARPMVVALAQPGYPTRSSCPCQFTTPLAEDWQKGGEVRKLLLGKHVRRLVTGVLPNSRARPGVVNWPFHHPRPTPDPASSWAGERPATGWAPRRRPFVPSSAISG